ncbi:hypothetical protein [Hymenobacter sp. PAMC 26628]|uniref:hypothetical protein n=1 Tax=Hymenobacter sp. PAMC 26628 TaxID=1484118 RepID=UPI000B06807C|nr:hypothetical protein [Hymenobacter sp. PAMC 26628]
MFIALLSISSSINLKQCHSLQFERVVLFFGAFSYPLLGFPGVLGSDASPAVVGGGHPLQKVAVEIGGAECSLASAGGRFGREGNKTTGS